MVYLCQVDPSLLIDLGINLEHSYTSFQDDVADYSLNGFKIIGLNYF